jgi:hypothetical protein
MRPARAERGRIASLTTDDVDQIEPEGVSEVETVFDRTRFARFIAIRNPRPDESVARYVARLRRRPRELCPELAHQRRHHLDELRDALRRVG